MAPHSMKARYVVEWKCQFLGTGTRLLWRCPKCDLDYPAAHGRGKCWCGQRFDRILHGVGVIDRNPSVMLKLHGRRVRVELKDDRVNTTTIFNDVTFTFTWGTSL